jgi:putative hydrolase of the HAD superfamily
MPATVKMDAPMRKPGRMDEAFSYELRPVHALLFDLGGVVINFDFEGAFRLWASRAGCDPRLIAERFSIDDSYEQHERGEIPASSYFAALRQSLGIDLSDEDFVEGWNDVYLGLVPGMSEVLSVAQRHLPLFAFTNSNPTHKSVWEHLYATELRPFQTVFVSSDLGARKPDPEAFHLVARRMGFEPEEVLFFDDGPGNVEGARTAGMQGVLVGSIRDVHRALSRIGLEVEP